MEDTVGRGDGVGRTRGLLSALLRGFEWKTIPSQARGEAAIAESKGSSLLQLAGGEVGRCYWKATWQQALKALKLSPTSTSRNLF